jgi:hypothetical protein
MKAADLLVKPNLKLRARRKVDTKKPKPTRPNEWWGIDMTKVMIDGFGWVYLVVVLDWHTKKVVGHYAGLQARAWLSKAESGDGTFVPSNTITCHPHGNVVSGVLRPLIGRRPRA